MKEYLQPTLNDVPVKIELSNIKQEICAMEKIVLKYEFTKEEYVKSYSPGLIPGGGAYPMQQASSHLLAPASNNQLTDKVKIEREDGLKIKVEKDIHLSEFTHEEYITSYSPGLIPGIHQFSRECTTMPLEVLSHYAVAPPN